MYEISYLAKYLRISEDDDDMGESRRESNSILNQRKMLDSYIAAHDELSKYPVREFIDDGVSGVSFQRPGVRSLLEEVRRYKVCCIVVKDDCVIKARTPQTLENRHFLRIGTEFRAIQRPQRAAYHIETS